MVVLCVSSSTIESSVLHSERMALRYWALHLSSERTHHKRAKATSLDLAPLFFRLENLKATIFNHHILACMAA